MHNIHTSLLVVSICITSACTWVSPGVGTENIALVKPAHVEQCKLVGTANAGVKHKIIGLKRKSAKVADELINLAKNEAFDLGGDTIVAKGKAIDGKQAFSVYKCAK